MIKKYFRILNENKFVISFNLVERLFFFLIFLIIAKRYPVNAYGELITVFSIANIFIILFDFGLPVLLQRELSLKKASSSEFLSSVIIINLIFLPLYFLFVILYCGFFFPDISFELISFTALTVYIFSISNIINKALSGLSDFKNQFNSLVLSRTIIMLLFLPAAYLLQVNLNTLLIIIFSGACIQMLSLYNNLNSNNLKFSLRSFNYSKMKSLLILSAPLGLAIVFNFLYDKIDIVLISMLSDFNQTAFYSVSYGIFKASAMAYSFLFTTGMTRVTFLSKNKRGVKLFFKKYSAILIQISCALSLILFFGSDLIIKTIYADKFDNSISVLKILSFATIGLALNNLTGIILNSLGLFRMNMNVTLLGLIINVILNLILIPKYGILAAAFVTVVTEYFIFIGDYFYLRKFLA